MPEAGLEAVPKTEQTPKKQFVITQTFKDLIVKRCTEELISPTKLAAEHGIAIRTVRKWVKDSGAVLPSKYTNEIQQLTKNPETEPELAENSNSEVIIHY